MSAWGEGLMTFLVLQASGSFPYCYMHYLHLTPARSGIITVWHSQIWPHLFTPSADFSWYSDGLQWWYCWRKHYPLVLFKFQIFTFSDVSMWVAVLLLPSHYPFLKVKKKNSGESWFLALLLPYCSWYDCFLAILPPLPYPAQELTLTFMRCFLKHTQMP